MAPTGTPRRVRTWPDAKAEYTNHAVVVFMLARGTLKAKRICCCLAPSGGLALPCPVHAWLAEPGQAPVRMFTCYDLPIVTTLCRPSQTSIVGYGGIRELHADACRRREVLGRTESGGEAQRLV